MEHVKHAFDATSLVAGIATFLGALPTILGAVASAMSIAWSVYRFREYRKGKKNDSN